MVNGAEPVEVLSSRLAAILGCILLAASCLWLSRHLSTLRLSRQRLFEAVEPPPPPVSGPDEDRWLTWWLIRAGYRSPDAPQVFTVATTVLAAVGLLFAYLFYSSGSLPKLVHGLSDLPSGMGDIFLPFAYAMPWLVFLVFAGLPTLMVRAARRKRVALVEQDLPITLELLATLGEAGIGFDAALERILSSQDADRPLAEEFRSFQLEVLGGRPRVACLRGLSRRLDVSAFTIFISALVQANQVGAGVADVLRRQVEELRNRRRERALTMAAAMPVKLLFPLIICFLPGIFIAALGPAFYQFFQLIDSLNRTRGGP